MKYLVIHVLRPQHFRLLIDGDGFYRVGVSPPSTHDTSQKSKTCDQNVWNGANNFDAVNILDAAKNVAVAN